MHTGTELNEKVEQNCAGHSKTTSCTSPFRGSSNSCLYGQQADHRENEKRGYTIPCKSNSEAKHGAKGTEQ